MYQALKEKRRRLILAWRRYRSMSRVSFEKGWPRLHIHEKFEKQVKWILRALLIIGLAMSIYSFQVWYINLLLAIALVLLEQLFERVIFIFTTIFLTPIPDSYDPDDWKGMIWGIPFEDDDPRPFIASPFFKDIDAVKKVFGCIKSWNYDSNEDFDNNIIISAIIENDNDYHIYMYPSLKRQSLKAWDERMKRERPDREHHGLVMQIMFGKRFRYKGSNFEVFKERYQQGKKFMFAPYYLKDGEPIPYKELGYIVKNSIKIKHRNELTRKDLEFERLNS